MSTDPRITVAQHLTAIVELSERLEDQAINDAKTRELLGVTPVVIERFWAKVDKARSCWLWTACTRDGYGKFAVSKTKTGSWRAHRLAYTLLVGPIPDGLHLDHLCRNRACVNPDHLEPVTPATNLIRGIAPLVTAARHRDQTHCKNGHPLFGENLYIRREGGRRCRECGRRWNRENYARRKGPTA